MMKESANNFFLAGTDRGKRSIRGRHDPWEIVIFFAGSFLFGKDPENCVDRVAPSLREDLVTFWKEIDEFRQAQLPLSSF